MKAFSNDRQLYLAYRLGELPPEERHSIEDRMLTDDEFSDRMQETEYDLLQDYRADRLNSSVRRQVERAFSRDELRQPLSFASRTGSHEAAADSKRAHRFGPAFRFACAAAALLLIAITGWVIAARRHSGTESPAPAARNAPEPPSSPQNSDRTPAQTTSTSPQLPGETAVLLLAPTVTRGAAAARLELRPATRTVTVQWVVPPNLVGHTFSLSIQQNGNEIAQVPASNVQHIDGSDVENFSLPRTVFSTAEQHTRYAFLIRTSGPAPAMEAEFPVLVSRDVNH